MINIDQDLHGLFNCDPNDRLVLEMVGGVKTATLEGYRSGRWGTQHTVGANTWEEAITNLRVLAAK
jgi:hypothetical protein